MDTPRLYKGLDPALQLLDIISNKEEYKKMLNQLKEYNDKAEKYFNVYKGIKGAEKEAERLVYVAKQEAGTIVANAKTKLDQVEKKQEEVNSTAVRLQKKADTIRKESIALEEQKKAAVKKEQDIATALQEAKASLNALSTKEKELIEKEAALMIKQQKLDNITKGLGEL